MELVYWPVLKSLSTSPLAIRLWHLHRACKTNGYLLTAELRARLGDNSYAYSADLTGNQEHVRNFTSFQEIFTKYHSATSTHILALSFTTYTSVGKGIKKTLQNVNLKHQVWCPLWVCNRVNFSLLGLDQSNETIKNELTSWRVVEGRRGRERELMWQTRPGWTDMGDMV